MERGGFTSEHKDFLNKICSYGGVNYRETDLFLNQNAMAFTKRILKGFKVIFQYFCLILTFFLKGVDNIYTQHTPLVKDLVEQLIRGRLKETSYPFLGNSIRDK